MNDIIEIEIVGWTKYQHHNGARAYTWFKMSSNFFDDHEFRNCHPRVRIVWLYLLSSAAKSRSSVVKVSLKCIASDCQVYLKHVESAIKRFEEIQILRVLKGTLVVPQRREEERRGEKRRGEESTHGVEAGTISEAQAPPIQTKSTLKKVSPKVPDEPSASSLLWDAYQSEYFCRWKKDPPPRNARVNSNLKKLASEYGLENSVAMIKHFFKMPDTYYLRNFHPVGILISQSHQIFSSMTTGKTMSKGMARSLENASTLQETFAAIDRGEV